MTNNSYEFSLELVFTKTLSSKDISARRRNHIWATLKFFTFEFP